MRDEQYVWRKTQIEVYVFHTGLWACSAKFVKASSTSMSKTCWLIQNIVHFANNWEGGGGHTWGTFAKPLAPRGSSGIMWVVNQHQWWLVIGWRYQPQRQTWMKTHTFAISKEPRYRCSITVQLCTKLFILHVYKFWVTYPCERRSYASLKSEDM